MNTNGKAWASAGSVPARLSTIALAIAIIATGTSVFADDFPSRPLRLLLGFRLPAGQPTSIARTLADQLAKDIGQRVVVENRTGASGNLATSGGDRRRRRLHVSDRRHAAGGQRVAVSGLSGQIRHRCGGRRADRRYRQCAGGAAGVKRQDRCRSGWRARTKPDAVSYATVGVGSSSHLAGVALDLRAGTKMLAISYRGGGEALKDLLAGQVDAWFAPVSSVLGAIRRPTRRAGDHGPSGRPNCRTCQPCRIRLSRVSISGSGLGCSRARYSRR